MLVHLGAHLESRELFPRSTCSSGCGADPKVVPKSRCRYGVAAAAVPTSRALLGASRTSVQLHAWSRISELH